MTDDTRNRIVYMHNSALLTPTQIARHLHLSVDVVLKVLTQWFRDRMGEDKHRRIA